jgi:hypothetical protein
VSRWVQPSLPEIRNDTANTSAGSAMDAQAQSIIWTQRSITSPEAVANSWSLLSKWL